MHFSGNLSIQTARIKEKKKQKNSLPQFQPRDLITNSFKMQFSVFERSLLAINCNRSTAPTLLSSPGWIFILGYFNHVFLDVTLFYIIYFPFLGVNKKASSPFPTGSLSSPELFLFLFWPWDRTGHKMTQDDTGRWLHWRVTFENQCSALGLFVECNVLEHWALQQGTWGNHGSQCQVTAGLCGVWCTKLKGGFRSRHTLWARLKAVFPAVNMESNVNPLLHLLYRGRTGGRRDFES